MRTCAIMQPYFLPYVAYFRLFAAADVFVLLDNVQFPRRGYVHRNQLLNGQGKPDWLTLSVIKAPQDTNINGMTLRMDHTEALARQLERFPTGRAARQQQHPLYNACMRQAEGLADYVTGLLLFCCQQLDIGGEVLRSSSLDIPPDYKGQDRILAINELLGCKRYINAPSGVSLYDQDTFRSRGIKLEFLPETRHSKLSVFERLIHEDASILRREILSECRPANSQSQRKSGT